MGDGTPARSEAAAAQRASNLAGLHELLAQAAGSYRALPSEVSMAAIFTLKETASTGYKASLAIGTKCRIEVRGGWTHTIGCCALCWLLLKDGSGRVIQ